MDAATEPIASLEQHYRQSAPPQLTCRRESRDSATHDNDIAHASFAHATRTLIRESGAARPSASRQFTVTLENISFAQTCTQRILHVLQRTVSLHVCLVRHATRRLVQSYHTFGERFDCRLAF